MNTLVAKCAFKNEPKPNPTSSLSKPERTMKHGIFSDFQRLTPSPPSPDGGEGLGRGGAFTLNPLSRRSKTEADQLKTLSTPLNPSQSDRIKP
ncbi:MAG TPA: hypothetical protein VGN23_01485, partial [Verrucomicrobiae bacterium]